MDVPAVARDRFAALRRDLIDDLMLRLAEIIDDHAPALRGRQHMGAARPDG